MKPASHILLALLLFIFGGCEVEEDFANTASRADRFLVHDSADPVNVKLYDDMPDDGRIAIDLGEVDLGATRSRYLLIRNGGNNSLVLTRLSLTPDSSSNFQLSCKRNGSFGECPSASEQRLEAIPDDDLVIRISYKPSAEELDQAGFMLELNAEDHPAIEVSLSGSGVTPEIQVCINDCRGAQDGADCDQAAEICHRDVTPASLALDFGEAGLFARLRRRIIVRNRGDRPLIIDNLDASSGDLLQFKLDLNQNTLPITLEGKQEIRIYADYDPTAGGRHQSVLKILSNDAYHREIQIVMDGRGMAPRACPDTTILDFQFVPTGEQAVQTFSIKNCGLLDLNLLNLSLAADSSPYFEILDPQPMPLLVAPEAEVEFSVRYRPGATGADLGGVEIHSDDPASDPISGLTGTITLTGSSRPRACTMHVTPGEINFGATLMSAPETVALVITNQGNDPCILEQVQISQNTYQNEFSILEAPAPDAEFEPGEMLLVTVQYHPNNQGSDNGRLSIFGTDSESGEIQVALSGEGIERRECDLRVSTTSLQFGTVGLNRVRSQTVQLSNVGYAICRLDPVALIPEANSLDDFTVSVSPQGAFPLAPRDQPGNQTEIEITYSPTTVDRHRAKLWLHTDDDPDFWIGMGTCYNPSPQQGDACIQVSGLGAELDIEVVPANVEFGVVTVGCNSPGMRLNVHNLGAYTYNITDFYLDESDPDFEIVSAPATPYSLSGGSSLEVILRYHPQDTQAHAGSLYIQTDSSIIETLAVPLSGQGTHISDQTDLFRQSDQVKADVLFVVDNSTSMEQEQLALAQNFESFIQHTVGLDVDFQIGVIATEVNAPEFNLGSPPRDIHPGVLINAPGRPRIITNQTPDLTQAFIDNVTIGVCCSDEQEAGLQAAWLALNPPNLDDPEKNLGFLRDDAKLYVVILSDEQDQSRGEVDFYVDFFQSIKGPRNTELLTISAICGDLESGCNGAGGFADSGSRYIDTAGQTGGMFISICTDDWADSLSQLGLDAFAPVREYALTRLADQPSIQVTVDGQPVPPASCSECPDGFSYLPEVNSIYFGDDHLPGQGSDIQISYSALCL